MGKLIQPNFKSKSGEFKSTVLSTEDDDLQWQIERDEAAWKSLSLQEREEHLRLERLKEIALDSLWEQNVLDGDDNDPDFWVLERDERDLNLYFLINEENSIPFKVEPTGQTSSSFSISFLKTPSKIGQPSG